MKKIALLLALAFATCTSLPALAQTFVNGPNTKQNGQLRVYVFADATAESAAPVPPTETGQGEIGFRIDTQTFRVRKSDGTWHEATAEALRTASGVVTVGGATAPTSGQVLMATSSTAATWQTPAAGGLVTSVNGHTGVVVLVPSDLGLGSVTNDAQLKRAANDFAAFANKAVVVGGDLILIEDSTASGAKKYVLASALPYPVTSVNGHTGTAVVTATDVGLGTAAADISALQATAPTSGQKAALAGTSGTPGSGNKYVTDADSRNSDARTPTAHATTHQHGGSDEVATATAAANAIPKAGSGGTLAIGWLPTGSTSSTVTIGNDSRLSDARTPTTHATTHVTGGSDVIANAVASGNAGLLSGSDKAKLDGIGSGANVTSVFSRTGAVTAQSGDYTKSQVGLGNVPNVDATDMANASAGQLAIARGGTGSGTASAAVDALGGAASTGTGGLARKINAALVTPDLDTPSALVGTNITGTAAGLTAGNVTTNADLTGEVISVGNATTIATSAVTNSKLADMAASTFKMRVTGSTGVPQDGTATQATAALNAMVGDSGSGGTKGLVPAPASGDAAAGKFLKADGTFAVPPVSSGTVTSVSVTTANGVSGSVATATTTPAITLTLGAITPSSVAASGTVSGSNITAGGNVTGNAATVTTNANLTGPITSAGNATAVAAQTGTGSTFMMSVDPTAATMHVTDTPAAATTPIFYLRDNKTTTTTTPDYVLQISRQNSATASWYFGVDGNTDGVLATNNGNLRLGFDTGGTFTEVARYDVNSRFGIGDTSPSQLLSVGSGHLFTVSTIGAVLDTGDSGGNTTPLFRVRGTRTTSTTTPTYSLSVDRQNSSAAAWYFGVDGNASPILAANGADARIGFDSGGTFTERYRLNFTNGGMSIGTTTASPSNGLLVAGAVGIGSTTTPPSGGAAIGSSGQLTVDSSGNLSTSGTANSNMAALSLKGRSANSAGASADIAASAASDCVYRESGSTVGCGTVVAGGIASAAVTYAKLSTDLAVSQGVPATEQNTFSGAASGLGIFGGLLVATNTAYCSYLTYTKTAIVFKHINQILVTAGTTSQTAEIGLFSAPAGPANATQTLTKIVADGTLTTMLSGAPAVIQNTTGFNGGSGTSVAAGTHLFACFRAAFGGTQPTMRSWDPDMNTGRTCTVATPGALTSVTTMSCVPTTVVNAGSAVAQVATTF